MKFAKRLLGLGMAALMAVSFAACSGEKSIDTEKLTEAVLNGVTFDTVLSAVDDSTAATMYTLPDGVDVDLYLGSGAFSDEFAVFKCVDASIAADVTTAVKEHLSDVKYAFEDYLPEEADKVADAVVVTSGSVVVLCVTSDAANADKIISEQLK